MFGNYTEFITVQRLYMQLLQNRIISAFRLPKVQIWSRVTLRSVENPSYSTKPWWKERWELSKMKYETRLFPERKISSCHSSFTRISKHFFLMPRICIKTSVIGDLFHHLPFFVELPLQCQLSRWESPPQASAVAACCSKCRSGWYIPWKFKL